MNAKGIVFLDLLGFGDTALNDPAGAMKLISDYQAILENKIKDQTIHPNLSHMAEDLCADSFEYLLPFSDSIFITSNVIPKFLKQLAHLLRHSFDLNSYDYSYPINKNNPIEVSIPQIDLGSGNTIRIRINNYPVLFRGGLSFGLVNPIEIKSINKNFIINQINLTGPAVVKAVGLEKSGKGPRLFADKNFYDQVPADMKYCFSELKPNELYEFLWTALLYRRENDCQIEIREFSTHFLPALNLWNAFNHFDYGIHYFEFIRLIIKGTIAHFEKYNARQLAINKIKEVTVSHGIYTKLKDIIN